MMMMMIKNVILLLFFIQDIKDPSCGIELYRDSRGCWKRLQVIIVVIFIILIIVIIFIIYSQGSYAKVL